MGGNDATDDGVSFESGKHFLLLFRDHSLKYRAVYLCEGDCSEGCTSKVVGVGPSFVKLNMIQDLYKWVAHMPGYQLINWNLQDQLLMLIQKKCEYSGHLLKHWIKSTIYPWKISWPWRKLTFEGSLAEGFFQKSFKQMHSDLKNLSAISTATVFGSAGPFFPGVNNLHVTYRSCQKWLRAASGDSG